MISLGNFFKKNPDQIVRFYFLISGISAKPVISSFWSHKQITNFLLQSQPDAYKKSPLVTLFFAG
jgi:hypothetical protein